MGDTQSSHQVLSFNDEVAGYEATIDTRFDDTYLATDGPDEGLAEFFARPIARPALTWTPGTTFTHSFNPYAFFANARVSNRLSNYNLLSCTLCVKFILNGNAFYYGKLMAVVNPLNAYDDFIPDNTNYPLQPKQQLNILKSQRQHMFIDPTDSSGGCLKIPFYWPYNAIHLPTSNFSSIAEIELVELNLLRHANGSLDPIEIVPYVWAEDIHFSVGTTRDMGLIAPQMAQGPYKDIMDPQMANEYEESAHDGLISKPAFALAAAAAVGGLVCPPIEPYALATAAGLTAAGEVAQLFGFSKPCNMEPVAPFTPDIFGDMAGTVGVDAARKLTLDPKQEVTIDPQVTGISGVDEMALSTLFQKESYLTTFAWGSGTVSGARLFECRVGPTLHNYDGTTLGFCMTSMCHAAIPFRFWRGNIKFRLQVVASAFHKGRLRVCWDPGYHATGETNLIHSKIVDITADNDITFEVGWGQPTAYLPVKDISAGPVPFVNNGAALTATEDSYNGVIRVYVNNALSVATDPTTSNDVEVNVFVSAGDNFEVIDPDFYTKFQPSTNPAAPSRGLMDLQMDAGEPTEVETAPTFNLGPTVNEKSSLIYNSDPIVSIRQLLKRYTYFETLPQTFADPPVFAGRQQCVLTMPVFPVYRGWDPNSPYKDNAGNGYSYNELHLLPYYACAFMGRRGAIRRKFVTSAATAQGIPVEAIVEVARSPSSSAYNSQTSYLYSNNAASISQVARGGENRYSLISGGHVSNTLINNVINVEFPYISNARFQLNRQMRQWTNAGALVDNDFYFHSVNTLPGVTPNNNEYSVFSYVAVGEDFSLNYHVGPPVLYIKNAPTAQA